MPSNALVLCVQLIANHFAHVAQRIDCLADFTQLHILLSHNHFLSLLLLIDKVCRELRQEMRAESAKQTRFLHRCSRSTIVRPEMNSLSAVKLTLVLLLYTLLQFVVA